MPITLPIMTISIKRFRSAMHKGQAGGYKHPKLFAVMVATMIILPPGQWAVHMKNHASDPCHVFDVRRQECCRNMGMLSLSYPVLENHLDEKALDDKIRHVVSHSNLLSLDQYHSATLALFLGLGGGGGAHPRPHLARMPAPQTRQLFGCTLHFDERDF